MNTQDIEVREIPFGSEEHKLSIELRNLVLRKPLGLTFLEEDLAKEDTEYHLAAFYEKQIVGILLLKPISDTEIKMRQVATSPNYQGKGVGSKLVAFSEKFAKQKGVDKISLHARQTAVPFYLRMNYQIEGDMFEEVSIPHYKMHKNL